MTLQAIDDRFRAVDEDGLIHSTVYIVDEEREAAVVVEVGVGHDDVANSELLVEREWTREAAGVERDMVVQEIARQEAILDASPRTSPGREVS